MIRFVFCCLFYINSVFYQLLFNNRFYNFFCMLAQLNQVFLFCFVHLRDLANRNTYIGITEFYCIINSFFMNISFRKLFVKQRIRGTVQRIRGTVLLTHFLIPMCGYLDSLMFKTILLFTLDESCFATFQNLADMLSNTL